MTEILTSKAVFEKYDVMRPRNGDRFIDGKIVIVSFFYVIPLLPG